MRDDEYAGVPDGSADGRLSNTFRAWRAFIVDPSSARAPRRVGRISAAAIPVANHR